MIKNKSTKHQQAQYRAAGRMYAAMAGVDPKPMDLEPIPRRLSPKKTAVQLPKRTEADVLSEIYRAVLIHPKVAIVTRINSGKMTGINSDGSKRFVTFNKVKKANRDALESTDIRMADVELKLYGGRSMAIEAKEPGFVEPDWKKLEAKGGWNSKGLISEEDARLLGQRRYLKLVESAGGIGIFANDVQTVLDALETV